MQRQTIINFLQTKLTKQAMGLVNQMTDEGLYYYFNIYFRNFVADDFEAGKEYFERNIDKIITNITETEDREEIASFLVKDIGRTYNFDIFGLDEYIEIIDDVDETNYSYLDDKLFRVLDIDGVDDDSAVQEFVFDSCFRIF